MTVHPRVSSVAEVFIICVWGRLARSGTTSEWGGREGRGADFLGSSSRAVSAACVCMGGAAKAAEPFKVLAQKQMGGNAREHAGMCLRMEHKRCCHGQGLPGLSVSRQGPCIPSPGHPGTSLLQNLISSLWCHSTEQTQGWFSIQ